MKENFKLLLGLMLVVSLMGTAMANPYDANIYNAAGDAPASNPLTLHPGETLTLSYHVENFLEAAFDQPLEYDYVVVPITPGASADDLTVTLPAALTVTSSTYTDVGAIQIEMDASVPHDTEYRVTIIAGDMRTDIEFGAASRNMTAIPEFPTVALPIAAVIGLAFIFQRRKEE